jgi:serine/threonine-protein kinase RsbW
MSDSESTTGVLEGVFRACLDDLPRTAEFIDAFCNANDVAAEDALRLTLIVEELFTNTVTHGHGGDCDEVIRVRMTVEPAAVSLLYEDAAPAHDILARLATLQVQADAEPWARQVGGLGVLLVARICEGARYAFEEGRNRIWLRLPKVR